MVPFAPGPVAAARPAIATTSSPAMVTSTITQRGSARRVLTIAHLRASAGNFDRTTGWSASRFPGASRAEGTRAGVHGPGRIRLRREWLVAADAFAVAAD